MPLLNQACKCTSAIQMLIEKLCSPLGDDSSITNGAPVIKFIICHAGI